MDNQKAVVTRQVTDAATRALVVFCTMLLYQFSFFFPIFGDAHAKSTSGCAVFFLCDDKKKERKKKELAELGQKPQVRQ